MKPCLSRGVYAFVRPLTRPLAPPALRRWLAITITAGSALALSTSFLQAETRLTWGPSGIGFPAGGDGSWNLLSPFWTADNGNSYQFWPGIDTIAVFAGPQFSDIITVNAPITVSGLRFQSNNYDLKAGTGSLTLATSSGAAPRLGVDYYSSYIATIEAPLAGTQGVTIDGAGTITTTGVNTLTGNINFTSGTLTQSGGSFDSSNSLIFGATPTDGGAIGGRGTYALAYNFNAPTNLSQTFSSLQVASGDASVQVLGDSFATNTTFLTFGSMTRAAGSTVYFYMPYGTNGTDDKITLTSQATGFISPGVYANVNDSNGLDFAWRDAAGYVRPIKYGTGGDANTASVGTTTSITPGSNLYFRTTGNVSAQATATMTTLKLGGNLTLAASATLTVNGLLRTSGSSTISGGTGATLRAGNNADLAIRTDFDPNTSAFTGTITINTPIVANGTNALIKSGGGTLILGGANTYTGTTYVNGGVLRLNNAAALPSNSNVQLNGGVLELTSSSPTSFATGTAAGQIQWTGDGGFSAQGADHSVTLNGGAQVVWGDPGFIHNGNRLLLGSRVSNKTLTLTNPIDLGSGQRDVELSGAAVLSGNITGTGGLSFMTGFSTGSIQFTGNSTFSGGIVLGDVTLNVSNGSSLGTGPLTLAGVGGTFVTGPNSTTQTIPNNIILRYSSNLGQQFGGASTLTLTLNGVISGEPGAGFLQGGSNTLILNGHNTFTGRADFVQGTVVVGNDYALGNGTFRLGTTLRGDGTPRTVMTPGVFWNCTIAGTSDLTFAGSFNNDNGADATVTISNTGKTTFGDVGFSDDNVAHSVTFSVGGTSNAAINGILSGGPLATFGGLIKSGTGPLAIGGSANTYTGPTTINAGILSISTIGNAGAPSSLGASNSAAASLIINGGTLQYTGAGGSTDRLFQIGSSTAGGTGTLDASGTGPVQFTNTGTIVYGTTNQTRTFVLTGTSTLDNTLASVINNNGTGAVSVTKNGAGTWVLSGNSGYSGATAINAGTFKLGSPGTASAGPLGNTTGTTTVASGGTLDLNGVTLASSEGLTLSGPGAGGAGALTNSSAFAVTFGGTLTLGTGGAAIGGSGNITLTAGLATNANALTKVGPGTLILNSTSARTGNTEIDGGVLRLAHPSALGTTAQTLTLAGGVLDLATDSSVSAYNVVVANSALLFSNKATPSSTAITHALGTLSIGAQQLSLIAGPNVGSGTAGVSFGATTFTASGANFQAGAGSTITLGALNDGGTARTFSKTGAGKLTLSAAALSLVEGTTVNLNEGTLESSHATALGTVARITMSNAGLFAVRATQGLGAINGLDGSVDLSSFTLTIGGPSDLDSNFGGIVSGSGGLTKAGNGVLTLGGTNLYSGPTAVNAGQLTVTGSIAASSLTTVSHGATLAGTGTVGSAQIAGTLSPGLSPGVLTFTGDLTLQSGSTVLIELGGLARGTGYDGLNITGGLTFDGTLQVSFLGAFTGHEGDTFDLFNAATTTGTFDTLNLPTLSPGLAWDTTALGTTGEITVVPEPATAALLLGGLALLTRRRRSSVA